MYRFAPLHRYFLAGIGICGLIYGILKAEIVPLRQNFSEIPKSSPSPLAPRSTIPMQLGSSSSSPATQEQKKSSVQNPKLPFQDSPSLLLDRLTKDLKKPLPSSEVEANSPDLHLEDQAFSFFQRGYYATARKLALPLAKEGSRSAQTLLGEIYLHGLGIEKDSSEAAKWYQKAAELGDPEAQNALGLLHIHGDGVPKNPSVAAKLFAQAAKQGQVSALYNLGILHIEGKVLPQDFARAREFFRKAAEQGHVQAQYDLGILLQELGEKKEDRAEAAQWIERAARGGSHHAAMDYAFLLLKGETVKKDPEEGIYWLKRAAESGNVIAQNRLAHLYARGQFLEVDSVEAGKWHLLARQGGREDPVLDEFLETLSPEKKQAAQEAARLWAPHGNFGYLHPEI